MQEDLNNSKVIKTSNPFIIILYLIICTFGNAYICFLGKFFQIKHLLDYLYDIRELILTYRSKTKTLKKNFPLTNVVVIYRKI